MAIQLTTINGTDSIAATRITINDNFATLSDALNSVLQMVNISTGYIDNSTFGSNPSIKTGSLIASGEISSSAGDIIAYQGNIRLGVNSFLEFGNSSGVKVKRTTHTQGSGTISVLDFAASTGATATGLIGSLVLPRQTTANIKAIQNPELGSFVFDVSQGVIAYCVGTTSAVGGTGTWSKISTTGATSL